MFYSKMTSYLMTFRKMETNRRPVNVKIELPRWMVIFVNENKNTSLKPKYDTKILNNCFTKTIQETKK